MKTRNSNGIPSTHLAEEVPDVLRVVGAEGGEQESLHLNEPHQQVAVECVRNLAVEVARGLELVEPDLERLTVHHPNNGCGCARVSTA